MYEIKINDFLPLPITRLQFACVSDWEHCVVIEKNSDKKYFDVWLRSISADFIGIEAFFDVQEKNIHNAFVGFRINATTENIARCRNSVVSFIDAASVFSLDDFIRIAEFVSFENGLFNRGADFMELGVVNHWNSFGPMRFWNRNSGSQYDSFLSALETAPRFLDRLPGHAAIELAFLDPIPHWMGLQVSTEENDSCYMLSLEKVKTVLCGS